MGSEGSSHQEEPRASGAVPLALKSCSFHCLSLSPPTLTLSDPSSPLQSIQSAKMQMGSLIHQFKDL